MVQTCGTESQTVLHYQTFEGVSEGGTQLFWDPNCQSIIDGPLVKNLLKEWMRSPMAEL